MDVFLPVPKKEEQLQSIQDLGNYQESKKKNKNGKKGLVRNQSK